jgi:hypothetical protein
VANVSASITPYDLKDSRKNLQQSNASVSRQFFGRATLEEENSEDRHTRYIEAADGGVDRWARGQENASDHAPTWIMLDL